MVKFEEFLDALSADRRLPVPTQLLVDDASSEPIGGAPEVIFRQFSSRMELASHLDQILAGISGFDADLDRGLWSWLTLFYFDIVCPPDASGARQPGDRARYIPAVGDYTRYYRHLVSGPYRVFRAHRSAPSRALAVLCGPVHKPGEIAEQLASRPELITQPGIVGVATTLYFDPSTTSFRRGAAGKGGGSARRLSDFLNQIDLTWDLHEMSEADLLARLPREFDRFRNSPPQ